MNSVTIKTLQDMKGSGEKFCCITAYDATFARIVSEAGSETILVGDSLGMVVQGHDSTIPVTISEMTYHTASVCRGNQGSLVIADLPFMSYATPQQALESATQLMQAGAQMVKLEGGIWLCDTISMLVERGIPVCAHLGLTPQSVASLLVLECIPSELAADISGKLQIPVIGIGAGAETDAQVLVLHDLLGLTDNPARFVHDFMVGQTSIRGGVKAFVDAVKAGDYPREEHSYS